MQPGQSHPDNGLLTAYRQGQLTPQDLKTVHSHVEVCAHCQVTLRSLTAPRPATVPFAKASGITASPIKAAPLPTATATSRTTTPATAKSSPIAPAAERGIPPELQNHPRYRILRHLGDGSMGNVYLAEHALMDRLVAIKIIRASLLDNAEAIARFLSEVKTAARLDHPNIVRAYDAEQVGNTHMFVMEYVNGNSLDVILEKHGPLPIAHAGAYVRSTALALQHAYEKGTVHRDVKPANLMLTSSGELKLGDFGLAKVAREHGGAHKSTAFSTLMGTPDFLAPEQAENARAADIRADIYSLGCTFFYLLTGRTPFQANSIINLVMKHCTEPPPRVSQYRMDVPEWIVELILRMMAKSKNDRPQLPQQVADALAAFGQDGRILDAVPVPSTDVLAAVPAKPANIKVVTGPPAMKPGPSIANSLESAMGIATRLPERAILQRRPRPEPLPPLPPPPPPVRAVDDVEVVEEDDDAPKRKKAKRKGRRWKSSDLIAPLLAISVCCLIGIFALMIFRSDWLPSLNRGGGGRAAVRNGDPQIGAGAGRVAAQEIVGQHDLFNRRDLSGWKLAERQAGNWSVENGRLLGRATDRTYLYTEKADYRTYQLKMRVRVVRGEFAVITGGSVSTGLDQSIVVDGHIQPFEASNEPFPRVEFVGGQNQLIRVPTGRWLDIEVNVEDHFVLTVVDRSHTFLRGGIPAGGGSISLMMLRPFSQVEWESIEVLPLGMNRNPNPNPNPNPNWPPTFVPPQQNFPQQPQFGPNNPNWPPNFPGRPK